MSRHHWGSDVDVADGHVMAAGYTLRLELDEYRRGGAFRGTLGLARREHAPLRLLPALYAPRPRRAAGALALVLRAGRAACAREDDGRAPRGGDRGRRAWKARREILARLPVIRERYLLDVDAPPRMRSRYARLRPG